MTKYSTPKTLPRPDDPPAMVEAITKLNERGIGFDRPTHWQLKIDEWNFYPVRGTIYCDGALDAEPERGLDALLARLLGDRTESRHLATQSDSNHSVTRKPLLVFINPAAVSETK